MSRQPVPWSVYGGPVQGYFEGTPSVEIKLQRKKAGIVHILKSAQIEATKKARRLRTNQIQHIR
ncbi:MAG: hypothetical protein ACJ70T_10220 [Nitrososphaera sp.]